MGKTEDGVDGAIDLTAPCRPMTDWQFPCFIYFHTVLSVLLYYRGLINWLRRIFVEKLLRVLYVLRFFFFFYSILNDRGTA